MRSSTLELWLMYPGLPFRACEVGLSANDHTWACCCADVGYKISVSNFFLYENLV